MRYNDKICCWYSDTFTIDRGSTWEDLKFEKEIDLKDIFDRFRYKEGDY